MVLVRPLIERAAIISYLDIHPEAIGFWHNGWKHGERPSLARMLRAMAGSQVDPQAAQKICDAHNHLVHGDPIASYYNLINLRDGRAAFGRVRKTKRQRQWTLEVLVQFWTAVILRAPKALTQALADSLEGRDPWFPRIEATPEAFFQRCRDLRPAFFAEVFRRFTARLMCTVAPRYAAEMAPVRERFAALVVLDGSRLAAIAHRLKLLWADRAVVLPGCLLGVYDLGRGLCRALHFDPDAAASEFTRARAVLAELPRDTLVLGDRLYGTAASSPPCTPTTAGASSGATGSSACASFSVCANGASRGAFWKTGSSAPARASRPRPRPCATSAGAGVGPATKCSPTCSRPRG